MRRMIAIALLLLFGAVLAAPLLAQADESHVAACCRRNGVHHCSMGMQDDEHDPHVRAVLAKCPYCPASAGSVYAGAMAAPADAALSVGVVSDPAGVAQAESLWRIARDRSRQKRGPPAFQLV